MEAGNEAFECRCESFTSLSLVWSYTPRVSYGLNTLSWDMGS